MFIFVDICTDRSGQINTSWWGCKCLLDFIWGGKNWS